MRQRVKELLAPVVEELNKGGRDASELMDILTALRGPDFSNPGESLKNETTSRIRYAIGIRPSERYAGISGRYSAQGLTLNPEPLPSTDRWFFRRTIVVPDFLKQEGL